MFYLSRVIGHVESFIAQKEFDVNCGERRLFCEKKQ